MADDSPKARGREARDKRNFRLLVASVRDYAIFMLDPECRVATWNAGAERLKGYQADEVIGQHFEVFYTDEDRAAGIPMQGIANALMQGRSESEGWRVRKDGTRFWASAALTTLYDERRTIVGFAKVTRDLTERRQAEEVRLSLSKAEEALRLRDDFLTIASHELRTPLNALGLYLQGTKRLSDEGRHEALKTSLEKAMRQVDRLKELVDGLLDVSRVSEGKLTLKRERVDLGALLDEAIEDVRAVAEYAGSRIQVVATPEETIGWFDRLRITQLFMNLLHNAIKYGLGASIEVETSIDGDDALVSIRDHGIGIAEADLERIFSRFERAASSRYFGGLGLGLYISQAIAQAHGGSISVESGVGQGSRFMVRLPVLKEARNDEGGAWDECKATS